MKSIKKILIVLTAVMALAFSAFAVGCGKNKVNFQLDEASIELNVGLTEKLAFREGDGLYSFKYSSENGEIAKVDNNGLITALKKGNTRIVVSVGKVKQYCNVKVIDSGEVPHIELDNLNISDFRLNKGDSYDFVSSVVLANKVLDDVKVSAESSDNSIAKVEDGVITAVDYGSATIKLTAEYMQWKNGEIELTFEIKVVEDVNINLITNNLTLYKENSVGLQYEYEMGIPSVQKEGKDIDVNVIWESLNPEIATVDLSGKVECKEVGEATLVVTATNGANINSTAKVIVNVKSPVLSEPANLRVIQNRIDSEGISYSTLNWDKVDYASGYQVFIDSNVYEVDANTNEIRLDEKGGILKSGLIGAVVFRVVAVSDIEDVLNSEAAKLNYTFLYKDYEYNLLHDTTSYFECDVKEVDYNDSALNGEKLYYAPVSNRSYSFGLAPNGGVFKIVYITTATEGWGDRNNVPFRTRLKSMITSTESSSFYVGAVISFWAYSYNQDLTFYYAKTTGASGFASTNGVTVMQQIVVPANTWTRVMISISDGDFSNTMYNVLDASAPFYFVDFKICSIDYTSPAYGENGFYLGYNASELINALPVEGLISQSNFTSYKDQIVEARTAYDNFMNCTSISQEDKADLEARCHDALTNCEAVYAKRLINTLPSFNSYDTATYNKIKEARDYYTSLDDMAREKIENKQNLFEAEKKLFNLLLASTVISGDYIVEAGNISLVETAVKDVRKAYNEFSVYDYQVSYEEEIEGEIITKYETKNPVKELIGNIDALLDGETLASNYVSNYVFELDAKEAEEDIMSVDFFYDARESVKERYEEVKKARSLYDALTPEGKELIAYYTYNDEDVVSFITTKEYSALSNSNKKNYKLFVDIISKLEKKYDDESYVFVKELLNTLPVASNMKLSGTTVDEITAKYEEYLNGYNEVMVEYNLLNTTSKNKLNGEYILGVEKYSDRVSNVSNRLAVLRSALDVSTQVMLLPEYDDSDAKAFHEKNIDNCLIVYYRFEALSEEVKNSIPTWVKEYLEDCSNDIISCGKESLEKDIASLPREITLDDVGLLLKIKTIYDMMDDSVKATISNEGKLRSALENMNSKYVAGYDYARKMTVLPINYPWTSYSDSYRAKGTVTYDYDGIMGDVAKILLEYDTEHDVNGIAGNAAFRFDLTDINAIFAEQPSLVAIQFYVRTTANSDLYLATAADERSYTQREGLTIATYGSEGAWVPVTLTREMFQSLSGVIFRAGLVGKNTPVTVYLSNFFLIYADEYVKDIVKEISVLSVNERNYKSQREAILTLRDKLNVLNEQSYAAITNISKFEEIEVNIVKWDLAKLPAPNDMKEKDYETLEADINFVKNEYAKLRDSQKEKIDIYKLSEVESKLYSLKPQYIMDLIAGLPKASALVFTDDKNIDRIKELYEELSEDDKYEVTNYEAYRDVYDYYYSHWIKVFDAANPWVSPFASASERANMGCDSYRGKFISAEVVNDVTYGKVTKVVATRDASTETGVNFSAKFNISKVEEVMSYYGVEEVTLYVKCGQSRFQVNDGNGMKNYITKANEWSAIKLTKDEITAGSGSLSSDWLLSQSDVEYEIFISNFYLVIDE